MSRKQRSRKQRYEMLFKQDYKCYWCGGEIAIDTAVYDHIIPYCICKDNRNGNMAATCNPCNEAKGALVLLDTFDTVDHDLLRKAVCAKRGVPVPVLIETLILSDDVRLEAIEKPVEEPAITSFITTSDLLNLSDVEVAKRLEELKAKRSH